MKVIIDCNIFFSLLNPKSVASSIFSTSEIEFIAPEFMLSEFGGVRKECLRKSRLNEESFKRRFSFITSRITFVDEELYGGFMKPAIESIPDSDDAPYIALGLATSLPIWSNDSDLKEQNGVEVLTTGELIVFLEA